MPNRRGVLPMQMIAGMMDAGLVAGCRERIRPGSLDLAIGGEVYRVEGSFLPRPGELVCDILSDDLFDGLGARRHELSAPLERNVTYLARLAETLTLPASVYAYCNPKKEHL